MGKYDEVAILEAVDDWGSATDRELLRELNPLGFVLPFLFARGFSAQMRRLTSGKFPPLARGKGLGKRGHAYRLTEAGKERLRSVRHHRESDAREARLPQPETA